MMMEYELRKAAGDSWGLWRWWVGLGALGGGPGGAL